MEYIKKEELIEGEIYTNERTNFIFKCKLNPKFGYHYRLCKDMFEKNSSHCHTDSLRLATPEEKHWLNECIKLNKFITFEEAMKTFIPEYVECIANSGSILFTIGKIYTFPNPVFNTGLESRVKILNGTVWKFKPSTKEAYDAQFVVKEEIMEEKVIEPLPQFKVIETIETITKVENNEGNQFFIGDTITPIEGFNKGNKFTISGFRYNNAKTNICAITDVHSPNGIGIDKIEHYIEPKLEVKDEFILPEKWCIRQNSEIVNIWLNKNKQTNLYYNSINQYQIVHFPAIKNAHLYCNIQDDYIEITLDQFKKYVLKEEIIEETLLEQAKRL